MVTVTDISAILFGSESMDFKKVTEKVRGLLNKLTGALKAFPASVGNLCTRLTGILKSGKGKIDSTVGRLPGHLPEGKPGSKGPRQRVSAEKRRPMLFALGGFAVLFLILIIAILAANLGGPKKSAPVDLSAGPVIPPEDLFIPEEPDFLPDFLLEREPRRSWTVDDIRPYWRNPGNEGLWRGEVKSAVDKLMEGVP